MTKCEFEKQCFPGPGRRCADAEHPEDCEFYDFAVLVYNKALEEGKKQLFNADSRADAIHKLEALKKKENPP